MAMYWNLSSTPKEPHGDFFAWSYTNEDNFKHSFIDYMRDDVFFFFIFFMTLVKFKLEPTKS
jgi:hypothetical protein